MAVLKWPSKLSDQSQKAVDVCKGIDDNPTLFPNPVPTTLSIKTAVDEVTLAIANVKNRKGTGAERKAKSVILKGLMNDVVLYVQGIANASPENAEVIINAAGMNVKATTKRSARTFSVKNGEIEGQVLLFAQTEKGRVLHEWQIQNTQTPSPMPGPGPVLEWSDLPPTINASTVVNNLKFGALIAFRHRVVIKNVPGNWDNPIAITIK